MLRFARFLWIAVRYRLDALIDPNHPTLSRRWRWLLRCSPLRLLPQGPTPPAERLRQALTDMGPVFIKFGQLLSTRRDLLPADIADSLALLQDQVPPFATDLARAEIETALDAGVNHAFAEFDDHPIASASIAQVHGARLATGEQVVIKVVRPDIQEVILADLEWLERLTRWLDASMPAARRLHIPQIVADYRRTILGELDMLAEARNTQQLRDNFANSQTLYVPKVHHELCRPNLLVMERVFAVPIRDTDVLHKRGTDMELLAQRGVETFFTQVFEHNFFHADMHPGNIFVDIEDPTDPRYIAIDCAIIGSLTAQDQDYIARNLLAFFHRDYAEIARLHLDSGWVPADTDAAAFEAVIKQVCEPIFAKPLAEISFGHFLVTLFQTAGQFNMEVQPQLVLLQKTLLYIEGLGRELYPELDLWATAKPFMEQWMHKRLGPSAALRELLEQAPTVLAELPSLTRQLTAAPRRLRSLEQAVARQAHSLDLLGGHLERQARRASRARWAGAALLVLGGVLLWGSTDTVQSVGPTAGLLSAVMGSWLLVRT